MDYSYYYYLLTCIGLIHINIGSISNRNSDLLPGEFYNVIPFVPFISCFSIHSFQSDFRSRSIFPTIYSTIKVSINICILYAKQIVR